MPVSNVELLKGTLDLLILRTLELSPMHGSAIAERIAQVTQGTFQEVAPFSRPFIGWNRRGGSRGEWGESAEGRRVRSYTLTRDGDDS